MNKIFLFAFLLPLTACASAQDHLADVSNQSKDRLTVAAAQRELHKGMTTAEVVDLLGSPNMVTTDENRRESWVYDKFRRRESILPPPAASALFLAAPAADFSVVLAEVGAVAPELQARPNGL